MKPTFFSFLFVLAFCLAAKSQVISGLYSGTLYNDTTKSIQQYQLALSEYKGKITGYSYTTFVVNDTFYYGIRKIKALKKGGQLLVEDDDMLVNNFPESPAKGVKRSSVISLQTIEDTATSLSGGWQTNRTKKYLPVTGSLTMIRDNDSSQSALIGHLKELKIIGVFNQPAIAKTVKKGGEVKATKEVENSPTAALPYNQRTTKVLQTFTGASDSLVLHFYDNGVVDGDIISVYVNGQNIVLSARLTEAAVNKTVFVGGIKGPIEILLVAESLGTLPPNTGLLVVYDGTEKYTINFSADLQTNASIIFNKKRQ